MKIYTFELGQLGTNSYLILPENSSQAILVDAPNEAADTIPAFLKKINRTLAAILITHGHWDHIWDTAKLAELTGAKVYASAYGKDLIENPKTQSKYFFSDEQFAPIKIDEFPIDGQTLEIAGLKIKCFDAPGHCPGSLIYYIQDPKDGDIAFVGDVIFAESVGRTDLMGGSFADLEKSIKNKIYTLSPQTSLMTGHGPKTTVAYEIANNPYVRP